MRLQTSVRLRVLLTIPALLVAGALTFLGFSTPGGGDAALADAPPTHDHSAALPTDKVALQQVMRALWEEHITWTRMVIVDLAADLPSRTADQNRLLRNQTDIGNAVAIFYGRAAGTQLTDLLRGHVLIAIDVFTAAKADDQPSLTVANDRWTHNANQIADFLSQANPTAWRRTDMRQMMLHHLRLANDEAAARFAGDWSADGRAYDRVHTQALAMADVLSDGIVKHFPQRFR